MRSSFIALVSVLGTSIAVASSAGCAAPTSEDAQSSSQSDLSSSSSSVRLEKSHIEVLLDQKNVANSSTDSTEGCFIQSVAFRIRYDNPTLPNGTKLTLHAGETESGQYWVGDGFGYSDWGTPWDWGNVRDLSMSESGGVFSADTTAQPLYRYSPGQSELGQAAPQVFPAELQFVFRLELPDGTVLWDNRLRRDYEVKGNGAGCSGDTSGFVSRASWGPF